MHVVCIALVEESDSLGKPLRLRLVSETATDIPREQGITFMKLLIPEASLRGKN